MAISVADILIEGEDVLWQGQPDYARAARKTTPWRVRRLQHLAWLIGLSAVTAGFGYWTWLEDFPTGLLIFTLFFGLVSGSVGWAFVKARPEPADQATEPPVYLVTNRRVIIAVTESARTSVFRLGAGFVDLRPNGDVFDLWIFSSVEDLEVKLEAIADGSAVEKLVIKTLGAKAEERT